MSGMDSTAAPEAAPESGTGKRTLIMLILLFAFGVTIIIAAIVLTNSESTVEEDDSDQSGGVDGGSGGGSGGGGGDGGGPAPAPIDVATTPPKVTKSILLCTIGIGGVLEAMMPKDGVCDIVFYTHVMCPKCNETKRFTSIGDDTAYKALLVKAQSYSATTFGISLDQAAGEGLKRTDILEACADAWNEKIRHFGMLNIRNINDHQAVTKGSMQQLKVFSDFLDTKRAEHPGKLHIAVAARAESDSIESAPRNLATAINGAGEFRYVTIVIVKSHVTHWQYVPPEEIKAVGPNTMSNVPIKSQPTSSIVGQALKDAKIDTTDRFVMMSFTMGSAGFRMPDSWKGGVFDVPVVHSLMLYPQACVKDIGPEKDTDVEMSKRKENSTLHFLIMYDDHELFKIKAEHFYAKYLDSSGSGIAAFDVEYDDFANLCGDGKFRRLKAIKDVVWSKA